MKPDENSEKGVKRADDSTRTIEGNDDVCTDGADRWGVEVMNNGGSMYDVDDDEDDRSIQEMEEKMKNDDHDEDDDSDEDEDTENDSNDDVTVAVIMREKRETAGKRMSSLVGEAADQDAQFWAHETWNDEDSDHDSANASFHASDADSMAARDEFDSDFNDSEEEELDPNDNDHDAQKHRSTDAFSSAEDTLRKEERHAKEVARRKKEVRGEFILAKGRTKKRSKGGRVTAVVPGGVSRQKRVLGEGLNTGIVLGQLPPPDALLSNSSSFLANAIYGRPSTTVIVASAPPTASESGTAASADYPKLISFSGQTLNTVQTKISEPTTPFEVDNRVAEASTSLRTGLQLSTSPTTAETKQNRKKSRKIATLLPTSRTRPIRDSTDIGGTTTSFVSSERGAKKRKQQFSQEELLLEAVSTTEPENKRWLLTRVRIRDQATKESSLAIHNGGRGLSSAGGKHIERFCSRRGHLNTIHFPDMDFVPPILQQSSFRIYNRSKLELTCVVSGKPARYVDPLTGSPYFDLNAFRELRRRHVNGKPSPFKQGTGSTTPLRSDGTIKRPRAEKHNSPASPTAKLFDGYRNTDQATQPPTKKRWNCESSELQPNVVADTSRQTSLTARSLPSEQRSMQDDRRRKKAKLRSPIKVVDDKKVSPSSLQLELDFNGMALEVSAGSKTSSALPTYGSPETKTRKADTSTICTPSTLALSPNALFPEITNPSKSSTTERFRVDSSPNGHTGLNGSSSRRSSPRVRRPTLKVVENQVTIESSNTAMPFPPPHPKPFVLALPKLDSLKDSESQNQ
jgi:hypothetical protein